MLPVWILHDGDHVFARQHSMKMEIYAKLKFA